MIRTNTLVSFGMLTTVATAVTNGYAEITARQNPALVKPHNQTAIADASPRNPRPRAGLAAVPSVNQANTMPAEHVGERINDQIVTMAYKARHPIRR